MNVGILGTGEVARALGTGFVNSGHRVTFGTRDPGSDKSKALLAKVGGGASAGSFADAASFAEVAVLATQWTGRRPGLCGNDAAAKRTVGDTCTSFGWPPAIDLGGIEMSRYLEPLAMIWIVYGFTTNTWSHAFKLLRK